MEEIGSLSDEEQSALEDRFKELERRISQLEFEGSEGYTALKNQNRIVHYLRELVRVLNEYLGVDLPGPPSPEDPSESQ
jgi:hypothetical protein